MTITGSSPVAVPSSSQRLPYAALTVMMAMSFLLVTAEFLPNGMLTEMAGSLGVTPGQAGQSVTVTALVGLLVAPTVALAFPRLDRRTLLIIAAVAAGVSNVLVAIAPSLGLLLLSRILLGAAISAFWTMSITVAAGVAGADRVGRAVMFTTAGTSLATVAGVPLGVLLSDMLDWRAVFLVVGVMSALLTVPLRALLPRVPAEPGASFRLLFTTLRRPGVAAALSGHVLVVFGHFIAYTYIRLSLERVPGTDAGTIVLLLALFGVGGLVGNVLIGLVIDRHYALFGMVTPVFIAAAILALTLLPGALVAVAAAVLVWGFFFASWLLIINAWVGHRMPDRLEAGGSLVVVGFQLAIVEAAGVGGLAADAIGVVANNAIAVAALLAGVVLFRLANRRL